MVKFDEWADEFTKKVKSTLPDKDVQSRITKAGADVLANAISNAAKTKHHSNGLDIKHPHMSDDVHSIGEALDGHKDGTSTVGFYYKGYIARFLNDGTKTIHGDHWYDRAFNSAKPEVFAAMDEQYKRELSHHD